MCGKQSWQQHLQGTVIGLTPEMNCQQGWNAKVLASKETGLLLLILGGGGGGKTLLTPLSSFYSE